MSIRLQYKNIFKRYWLACFILVVNHFFTIAQERGNPVIKNFTPRDYVSDPQNWYVGTDNRGIIYMGNNLGLLEYDGVRFKLHTVSNNSSLRSVAVDSTGVIYVGAINEFGYFAPDKSGNLKYNSLVFLLDSAQRNFNDVWNLNITPEGVVFRTYNRLMIFNPDYNKILKNDKIPGTIKIIQLKNRIFSRFFVNNKYYMNIAGTGLSVLQNDTIVAVNGGKIFTRTGISGLFPEPDGSFMVTTGSGFFRYNPNINFSQNKKADTIVQIKTEIDAFLKKARISRCFRLENGNYILRTRNNGVVSLNKDFKLLSLANKFNGLQSEQVYYFEQYSLNCWGGLVNGFSRIETESPIQKWEYNKGMDNTVLDIIRFDKTLYLATSFGVYYLESKSYENDTIIEPYSKPVRIQGNNSQCWNFLDFRVNGKHELLVATGSGLFSVTKNKLVPILASQNISVYRLLQSKKNPNVLYVGTGSGLLVFLYNNGKWEQKTVRGNIDKTIRYFGEDENYNLWATISFEGIIRFDFKGSAQNYFDSVSVVKYDTTDGLPANHENKIFNYKNGIVFTTLNGFYKFNSAKNAFEPDLQFSDFFVKNKIGVFRFYEYGSDILLRLTKNNREWCEKFINTGNGFQRDSIIFGRFNHLLTNVIYPDTGGLIWFGGTEGLIKFDTRFPKNNTLPYNCLIRKVIIGTDSVLFGGNFYSELNNIFKKILTHQSPNDKPTIKYKYNSVYFEFAAPFYEEETATEYSSFLKGFDKEWTAWSLQSNRQFTNLKEGKYTFFVKAKNVYGVESVVTYYNFRILPPWYRTVWAYLVYVVLTGLAFFLFAKLYSRRLKEANIKLERIVEQRTSEIRKQNQQILAQNSEILQQKEEIQAQNELVTRINNDLELQNAEIIEQRNKIMFQNEQIKASIRYAQTIQKAILPFTNSFSSWFEHFIIYRPKDIVSGDFYWLSVIDQNRIMIAAVDCTGHGVPGAFMSMIGSRLLNEIVNENKIYNPKEILNQLNQRTVQVLKQGHSSNNDGMDLAVCLFERTSDNSVNLLYCGAKSPVHIFRNSSGEIITLKTTRKSIGGTRVRFKTVEFQNDETSLNKGDVVYILTDGIIDQNNQERKRFGTPRFLRLIKESGHKTMQEQGAIIEQELNSYQLNTEQRDDITIIGLRI